MTSHALESINGDVIQYPSAPTTLFQTSEPADIVKKATGVANALAPVIDEKKLFTAIQGRKHVRVEGWTLLGSMLGVFPVTVWCRPIENGWEARVEARTLRGQLVGAAEAQCTRAENTWKNRDDFALRSMAQTRATSKAMRLPLGFVVTLAGYDATPAEEMDGIERQPQPASRPPQRQQSASQPDPRPLPATEPQIKAIYSIGRGVLSMTEEEADAACIQQYNGRPPAELTRREAADFIDALKEGLPIRTQQPEPVEGQAELVDPDDLPFETAAPPQPVDAATLKRLLAAGEGVQMDSTAITEQAKARYGVASPRKLTQQQAETLIAEYEAAAG